MERKAQKLQNTKNSWAPPINTQKQNRKSEGKIKKEQRTQNEKNMHLFASYEYFIFVYYLLARAKHTALSQAKHGKGPNTKLTITHSFFEQQTPDFA